MVMPDEGKYENLAASSFYTHKFGHSHPTVSCPPSLSYSETPFPQHGPTQLLELLCWCVAHCVY